MIVREPRSPRQQRRERPLLLSCFYFIEVPLFGAATVLAYLLHFTTVFKTSTVNYDPSDVSIALPYIAKENRTISSFTAYVTTAVVPCSLIGLVESLLIVFAVCCKHQIESSIGSTGCYIGASIRRIIRFIGIYLFGLLITSALCDVLRKRVAALSPHFLSVCEPKPMQSYSSNPDPMKSENSYFSDDCFPRLSVKELQEASMNLPSYYTSLTAYAAIYTLLYLRLLTLRAGPVVTSLVLFPVLLYPFVIGMLEVAENSSHKESVIAGWILGSLIAYIMGHEIFSENFVPECKCPKIMTRKSKKSDTEANNVFEDAATPKFSIHGYDVAEDDGVISVSSNHEGDVELDSTHQRSEAGSHPVIGTLSPAHSKQSQSEKPEDQDEGHTAERKVIKEFQTYIIKTDVRGGLESPRPTQIRQMSKGQNRKQVLSTFQTNPEIEIHEVQMVEERSPVNITEDLHAPGNTTESCDFVVGVSPNIQEGSLIEDRPSSYHATTSLYVPEGCVRDGNSLSQGCDGRPSSYSFLPRSRRSSMSKEEGPTKCEPPETILTYFASDEEPDLLRGTPADRNQRVSSTSPKLQPHDNNKHDLNETSNLLREVFDVMNEKGEDETLSQDSQSSEDTITEDQPSIGV